MSTGFGSFPSTVCGTSIHVSFFMFLPYVFTCFHILSYLSIFPQFSSNFHMFHLSYTQRPICFIGRSPWSHPISMLANLGHHPQYKCKNSWKMLKEKTTLKLQPTCARIRQASDRHLTDIWQISTSFFMIVLCSIFFTVTLYSTQVTQVAFGRA